MFTSPHAAVRDAIEQAIPKLREMLADNGIMLGNATVNDQPTRNNNHENDFGSRSQNGAANRTEITIASLPEAGSVRVTNLTRHNNVVDTFA
jgi:flagellar hook-length control protein FliK